MRRALPFVLLLGCQETPKPTPTAVQTAAPAVSIIPIEVVELPPEKPAEKLLAQFTTRFLAGPKYEGRVANITKLARMLSDTRLRPGEEFSFNKAVGPRTKDKGFKDAPTYFLGEITEGVGGGVCQVSSTMYAAALHVNAEILDRRPHSRVSNYIEPGLDATVNYPEQCWDTDKPDPNVCFDLKLKNPYDFDLIFRFEVGVELGDDEKRPLTVAVFGTGEVPEVTSRWKAFSTPAFDARYRRVIWWKDERKRLKQSGKPGLQGARVITIKYPDGGTDTKTVYSRYQPVPEVWEVGMEWQNPEKTETEDDGNEVQPDG